MESVCTKNKPGSIIESCSFVSEWPTAIFGIYLLFLLSHLHPFRVTTLTTSEKLFAVCFPIINYSERKIDKFLMPLLLSWPLSLFV